MMSEPTSSSSAAEASAVALAFARMVAAMAVPPADPGALRGAGARLVKAIAGLRVSLAGRQDGVLVVNGTPIEPPDEADASACRLLASRLVAYGIAELTITDRAVELDLAELGRLLGDAPTQDDPPKFFAVRASVIDKQAIPRTLVQREAPPTVDTASSLPAPVTAPVDEPVEEPLTDPVARIEHLAEAIDVPSSDDARLGPLLLRLQDTDEIAALEPLLRALVEFTDLAFRRGQWRDVIDAMAGLVAIEFRQLARDASDERRRVFVQALRQLANPLLLRQLAVLRHRMVDDPTRIARLQAVLYRFGTDGVSALMDEFANVPTMTARALVLDALRRMKRTHDALYEWVRASDDLVVRQAATILGALGDERSLRMLSELLRRPEPRVRRVVVAELEQVAGAGATDLLGVALGDGSPLVRARAVAALASRGADGAALLLPLIDRESDPEVLFAAMHAVAVTGGADAIAALIACARGESAHPWRRESMYRLQACAALVVARTPQAMAAVGLLRDDRDREVREGSQRLVAQAARRTTGSMRVVAE